MNTIARCCLLVGFVLLTTGAEAAPASGCWDVFAHGAKGDGTALDTAAIQTAIDACHAAGGGRVSRLNARTRPGIEPVRLIKTTQEEQTEP
jgi:hypothetical protein